MIRTAPKLTTSVKSLWDMMLPHYTIIFQHYLRIFMLENTALQLFQHNDLQDAILMASSVVIVDFSSNLLIKYEIV